MPSSSSQGTTTSEASFDGAASIVRVRQVRVVFAPGKPERAALMLGERPVDIGREGEGLVLPDRQVSRAHARIGWTSDGGAYVEDLGSHNGTHVGGVRVAGRAALEVGAVIRIGGCVLVYLDHDLPAHEAALDDGAERLFGPGVAMQHVRREVELVSHERTAVLVTGETGVGKELVASEIHRRSGRTGAFVPVNCAAVTASLAESELFGHVAGSFTGATRRSEGLFAAAADGTLFLDEVGELPPELQPKLLRALALGEIRSVGAVAPQSLDVRVVAATNRDLDAEARAGRFRADLLARLGAWRIQVPPLRTRREDILPLAGLFLDRGDGASRLSADAAEALMLHDWPYNVRELEQAIASAALRAAADDRRERTVRVEHLAQPIGAAVRNRRPQRTTAEPPLAAVVARDATPTADELRTALRSFGGNISEVARYFRRTRKQIYRWARAHAIDLADARKDDD